MRKFVAYVVAVMIDYSNRRDVENILSTLPEYVSQGEIHEWVAAQLGIERGIASVYELADFVEECNNQNIDLDSVWLGYFMREVEND